jgi:hypothetical protein
MIQYFDFDKKVVVTDYVVVEEVTTTITLAIIATKIIELVA